MSIKYTATSHHLDFIAFSNTMSPYDTAKRSIITSSNSLLPQLFFNTSRPRQMRYMLCATYSKIFSGVEIFVYFYSNFAKSPKCPIDNKPALIEILIWWEKTTSHHLNQRWSNLRTRQYIYIYIYMYVYIYASIDRDEFNTVHVRWC